MATINTMLNPVRSGLILLLLLMANSVSTAEEKTELLSSIRPLDMLITELVGNDISHSALLNAQQSPHQLQLKPSQRQKLQIATTVYWYGAELEPMMSAILSGDQSLLGSAVNLRPDSESTQHDDHDEHHINVHYWLDRHNVIEAAEVISANLMATLPDITHHVSSRLEHLEISLLDLEKNLATELTTARTKSYLDLHDAWELLADDFNLNAFSSIDHQSLEFAGAKTILNLRRDIASGKYDCIIASPETNLRLVNNLVNNSETRVLILDALGNDLDQDSGFIDFLTHNIKTLAAC